MEIESIGSWWMWVGFIVFVLAMLAVDLFLLGGKIAHKVSFKEALSWSIAWVSMALIFNALLWWYLDGQMGRDIANQKALEFFTGYLIEKSLAVDNVFVWMMIFSYFAVPAEYQRRVLLYGVLGAIVMRAAMILLGAALIVKYHWILYFFGLFLLVSGIKMFYFANEKIDLKNNLLLAWMRRHMNIANEYLGEKFFIIKKGIHYATPMFLVLVLIEFTDLVFAVDSIPAIFAITKDPFIVFTSNIFAILGLRAMYFLLADVAPRFYLLKYGLALVLIFIGVKMLIVDLYKIPIVLALGVVATIIIVSIILSIATTRPTKIAG